MHVAHGIDGEGRMAIGFNQRQKKSTQTLNEVELHEEQARALEKIEEGQEVSPEMAQQLQPQLGNQALQALLNRMGAEVAASALEIELEEEEDLDLG